MRQRAVKGLGGLSILRAQDKQRVMDPADDPPPGQIRRPTGADPFSIDVDPGPQPLRRQFTGARIANSGQIIQPDEAVNVFFPHLIRRWNVPDFGAFGLNQVTGKQIVPGQQLPAPGKGANGAWFRLADESGGGPRHTGPARMHLMHPARIARHHSFTGRLGGP